MPLGENLAKSKRYFVLHPGSALESSGTSERGFASVWESGLECWE